MCIRKHFELGVAIAIDVSGYAKNLSVDAKKRIGGSDNPQYMAFLIALTITAGYALEDDKISVIHDDEEEIALNCYHFYRKIRKLNPEYGKKFIALTFADDSQIVPLQAADFLSGLVRHEAERKFHLDYNEWSSLFQILTHSSSPGEIKWGVGFYDKDRLRNMGKRLENMELPALT
jgi:hypothetical protein